MAFQGHWTRIPVAVLAAALFSPPLVAQTDGFGVGTVATITNEPYSNYGGIALSSSGTIFVSIGNSIQTVTPAGDLVVQAGNAATAGSADGVGPNAQFKAPLGICFDAAGNLFIADSGNNAIRRMAPDGTVTTLAGLEAGSMDGTGVTAQFSAPSGVAMDVSGNIVVADSGNNLIRQVTPLGKTQTLFSGTSIVDGNGAGGYAITNVACDAQGNYFAAATRITDNEIEIETQVIWEFTKGGSGKLIYSTTDSFGFDIITRPSSDPFAVDSAGNVFLGTGDQVTYLSATEDYGGAPVVVSIPTTNGTQNCGPLVCDPQGRLYFSAYNASTTIYEIIPNGAPPSIVGPPQGATISFGESVTLTVAANGLQPLTYQWEVNGTPIVGANSASYSTKQPGSYTVVVTNLTGSVTSARAIVASPSRLSNISTRANVGTGASILIGGFIVGGTPGSTEEVLVRGVGPALAQYSVEDFLAQPEVSLFDAGGNLLGSNVGWNSNANASDIVEAEASTGAFALALDSADSALLMNLGPGAYTFQISGGNATTGIALGEVYEVVSGYPQLANVSSRCNVSAGAEIAIAGFVVAGSQPVQVLLRGVGPALATYGISDSLAQPSIALYDSSGSLVGSEGAWGASPQMGSSTIPAKLREASASDMESAGAFSLATGSADSAMVAVLPPGSYTLQMSGLNNLSGVGLVEVYLLP